MVQVVAVFIFCTTLASSPPSFGLETEFNISSLRQLRLGKDVPKSSNELKEQTFTRITEEV